MKSQRENDFVFPGQRGKGLSNMALSNVLKRMDIKTYTVHGFRTSFRGWTAEETSYSFETCEAALSHSIGDATQQAYFRTDLFDKRRSMMNDWERFLNV